MVGVSCILSFKTKVDMIRDSRAQYSCLMSDSGPSDDDSLYRDGNEAAKFCSPLDKKHKVEPSGPFEQEHFSHSPPLMRDRETENASNYCKQ